MTGLRIHIDKIERTSGFSWSNARAGETVTIVVRAALTSDDHMFYKLMDSIAAVVLNRAGLFLDQVCQFLILWHEDDSVDVYVNDFPVITEIIAKRALTQGQVISYEDIADIRGLRFEGIEIRETDNVIYCFKVNWKFGLFFDLGRAAGEASSNLDLDRLSLSLGNLYRYLAFQHVYEILEANDRFDEMRNDGWFPFIELIASEFKVLAEIYDSKFEVDSRIEQLIQKFDLGRVSALTSKWWSKPVFSDKRPIMEAGISAYLQNSPQGNILCLKALLPEIEGLIRIERWSETGAGHGRVSTLIKYLEDKASAKAGSELSLMLPTKFIEYLDEVIFSEFDLEKGELTLSRNSSSHGVAHPDQYTRARALQTILALNQIYFYL